MRRSSSAVRPGPGEAARARPASLPGVSIGVVMGAVLGVLPGVWPTSARAAETRTEAAPPTLADVREAFRASDRPVLDRRGEVLQTIRVDMRARRLAWVAVDEMSPALRDAIVRSEDRHFWEHSGVDWAALARSAWQTALNDRTQGGSTLTMQLAGLLDAELARPAGGRSLMGKARQISSAQALESGWRKADILEAYLNLVPLRGELVGVPAASQALFGKYPSGLDQQEAAMLAAMVRAPNAAAPALTRRACALLTEAAQTCTGLDSLVARALARKGQAALGPRWAPHAARRAWQAWLQAQAAQPGAGSAAEGPLPGAPLGLTTTLDARVQRWAVEAVQAQMAEIQGHEVDDAAVVVLDNATGDALAWVGSAGAANEAEAVDAVLARRQPGSAIKPLVYELALERRYITPASLLRDLPTQRAAGGGLYLPENYDHRHHGWVPARMALASSLNIPAVEVGGLVGPSALFEHFNRFGLGLNRDAGHHGEALALGTAEVTLVDLTNAYRALANAGSWSPWRLLPGPQAKARRVADPGASFIVGQILSDNIARAPTFGLDSPLVTRGYAAVKTGTSKDMRDNWCIGYTQRYTVGVWVGNADGRPMRQVSGTTGAAPIWHQLVARLHEADPSRPPEAPPGVVVRNVERPGEVATREWFLADTAPRRALQPPNLQVALGPGRPGSAKGSAKGRALPGIGFGIRSPLDGSRFALDPDIPAATQRIVFDGAPGRWTIDGRPLGRTTVARNTIDWVPTVGMHRLEWQSDEGRSPQRLEFEVRGPAHDPS